MRRPTASSRLGARRALAICMVLMRASICPENRAIDQDGKGLRDDRWNADGCGDVDRTEWVEFHRLRRFADVRSRLFCASSFGTRRYGSLHTYRDRAMIEIIETGPFNTVQDLGRPGYRDIGFLLAVPWILCRLRSAIF